MSVTRFRRLAALSVAAATIVTLAAPAGGALAVPLFTFNVEVGSECVYLNGGPASVFATISQLDSAGTTIEYRGITLDANGSGGVCMAEPFYPTMKVTALVNGTLRTLGFPNLTIGVNRLTDVVSGRAPKGSAMTIEATHWTTYNSRTSTQLTTTATATGTYSVDTTSKMNLIGGDYVNSYITNASGDYINVRADVAGVNVRIGSPKVTTTLGNGESGTILLKDSAGVLRAKSPVAYNAERGATVTSLFMASGAAVGARVGDKVSVPLSGGISFTIPNLTVAVNSSTDVVSGVCQTGRQMQIHVYNSSPYKDVLITGICGANAYSFDVTSDVDIQAADKVMVTMRLPSGDSVSRYRVAI